MGELVLNQKRKVILAKIGIGMLITLIVLTFLSKTINGILMPKVMVTSPVKGSIEDIFESQGTIELENKYRIVASGNWKIKEVAVQVNQQVKKGDLLAVIDNSENELLLKKKELEILKVENSLENLLSEKDSEANGNKEQVDRSIKERRNELEIIKAEYEIVKKSMPKSGRILSNSDGIVTNVNVEAGSMAMTNQSMIEIATENTDYNIVWYMNPQRALNYEIGDKVSVWGKGITLKGKEEKDQVKEVKEYSMSLSISGNEVTPDKSQVKVWAEISGQQKEQAQVLLYEGDKADVIISEGGEIYEGLLPKSALTQQDNKYSIFVIREIPGALGVEKIVEQREVTIVDEDDRLVALKGLLRSKDLIVVSSTKPLSNRMQVQVR